MIGRPRKLSLRRTLFLIPNMFTLGSVFCAFYAMLLAAQAMRPWDLWAAAWMIGFAGIFDGLDGRVARLTKTESQFGLQLDSIADAVAFGVAPAWLFYHWGLFELGFGGFLVAFVYAAAAMIRLARFNVTEIDLDADDPKPPYFVGLPTPGAAGFPVLLVAIHSSYLGEFLVKPSQQPMVAAIVLCFAALMVSNVRFANFKHIRWSRRTAFVVLLILGAMFYIGSATCLEIALASGFAGYVAFHLAAAAVAAERRLFGKKATVDDEAHCPEPDGMS